MKKVTFIIPGFKGVPSEKVYKDIATIYNGKGFEPVILKIPWNRKKEILRRDKKTN